MTKSLVLTAVAACTALLPAAEFPNAEITNGRIRAKIYLPNEQNGYYRATRFDWSGVVYSLQYKGHNYYGPWVQRTDPKVRDFVYDGPDIVGGLCSSIAGPVDEFGQVGWEAAKPGGRFLKIGVGVLKREDEDAYDNYRLYDILDPGKWTVGNNRDSIEFTQELADSSSGYGYIYRKVLLLVKGKPEMVLEHSLKNTGTRPIRTTVYNHNFLVLDNQPPGPPLVVTVPFQIQTQRPPNQDLAEIRGNRIVYLKRLEGRDVVTAPLQGFGDSPKDNQIRIENAKLGAGMEISSDRPLARESLWSIRSVVAMEPFVAIAVEPGAEFSWKFTYRYYTLAGTK
ncbi:MAG: hypothetical protein ABSH49_33655 [Bryobacteraceae bacterium]|jgi:hypothetical protein